MRFLEATTANGFPSLVVWAMTFANDSRHDWKLHFEGYIALWLSMLPVFLGLKFQVELGSYFEEIYAWHNPNCPLNVRLGFRMLNIFDLYFGFEDPWWNEVVIAPETKLTRTIKYLRDKFYGDEYAFCFSQILRSLKKGKYEMIKMTNHYLMKTNLIFLLLTHLTMKLLLDNLFHKLFESVTLSVLNRQINLA